MIDGWGHGPRLVRLWWWLFNVVQDVNNALFRRYVCAWFRHHADFEGAGPGDDLWD